MLWNNPSVLCEYILLSLVGLAYSEVGKINWKYREEAGQNQRETEEPAAGKQDARGQVKPCGKIQINTNGLIYIVRVS